MIKANQRLRIVTLNATDIFRQPEGYRMKAPTGSWWRDRLASWCWTFLHKLRAIEPYGFTETIYTYTPSQQKEITDRLMEGIDEVFKRNGRIEDHCIILGAKDFSEMLASPPIQSMFTIQTQELHYRGPGGYKLDYYGLPVHVVPNVSGAAVIPKVIVERVVHRSDARAKEEFGNALERAYQESDRRKGMPDA